MKCITISLILLITLGCNKETPEERFKRLCPFNFSITREHLFKIPYEIIPNNLTYKIKDTITVRSYFSKDVYDLSAQRTFRLDSLLVRPAIGVFRFYDKEKWERTNDENYILFDSIYTHAYGNSTFALFKNEKDYYSLEFKILLQKTGRYVMIIGDQYTNNLESYGELINSAYTNEEICRNINLRICNVIEGESHMKELEPEFIHVDKNIAFDNYASIHDKNSTGVYGSGGYPWEWNGAYGFIVEE